MKKISKFLSIVMTLIMVISIIPMSSITATAATSGTCGDNVTWIYDASTQTLTISGTGEMVHYNGYNRPWKSYENSIETIVINNGVTTIGGYAFYECINITNVVIPDSVTKIDAFAFGECVNLRDITIHDGIVIIGEGAFFNCESLADITIPDSVIEIAAHAFSGCRSLTVVTIGESVTEIGTGAFAWCNNLTRITVDSNNEHYSSDEDGVLFNKYKTTLVQYPIGNTRTSYTIPTGVTTIGHGSFEGCSSITNITMSDSVTTIWNYAFNSCTNLTGIKIPYNVTTIGAGAFRLCESLTIVTIPVSLTSIGDYAFYESNNITDVYYSGTEGQWREISIGNYNEELLNATIHFNECEHEYNTVVTPPTCTAQGYTTYTCNNCNDGYKSDYINATGHQDLDIDAYCDHCDELLCNHDCHKSGVSGLFWMIINFFNRLFGSNKTCSCGVTHY